MNRSSANRRGFGATTRFDIPDRWLAEETLVFAIELTRTFISNFECDAGCVDSLDEDSLACGH